VDARQTLIYLLRHGEVVLAETRRFIGHLDVPLSAHGERQSRAQAARLAGVTGDVLGAAIEVAELAGLLAVSVWARARP